MRLHENLSGEYNLVHIGLNTRIAPKVMSTFILK